jgi:hypothetical protein
MSARNGNYGSCGGVTFLAIAEPLELGDVTCQRAKKIFKNLTRRALDKQ